MGNFLSRIRFPTMLGLAVLVLGLGSGVYLTIQNQNLISRAAPNETPQDIKITNIEAKSATISWRTNSAVGGFVSFGQGSSSGDTALDIRDQDSPESHLLHYVVINNLIPATTYKYKIISGKQDNLPEDQFTTAIDIQTQNSSKPIIGNVIDNNQSLSEGIVYLEVDGATPQSALIKNFGSFIIPTSLMRTIDLTNIFTPNNQAAKLTAVTADGRLGTGTFQMSDDNNLKQPIKIGEDTDLQTSSNSTLGISATFAQMTNQQSLVLKNKFDLNRDGNINTLDYVLLLKNFGKVPPKDSKFDLNNDGRVDKKDQDILATEITKATNH